MYTHTQPKVGSLLENFLKWKQKAFNPVVRHTIWEQDNFEQEVFKITNMRKIKSPTNVTTILK